MIDLPGKKSKSLQLEPRAGVIINSPLEPKEGLSIVLFCNALYCPKALQLKEIITVIN